MDVEVAVEVEVAMEIEVAMEVEDTPRWMQKEPIHMAKQFRTEFILSEYAVDETLIRLGDALQNAHCEQLVQKQSPLQLGMLNPASSLGRLSEEKLSKKG